MFRGRSSLARQQRSESKSERIGLSIAGILRDDLIILHRSSVYVSSGTFVLTDHPMGSTM